MSAIPLQFPPVRPSIPAPNPAQTPLARADFFRAALANVQAGVPAGVQPAIAANRPAPVPAVPEDRPARPGALLDIRV